MHNVEESKKQALQNRKQGGKKRKHNSKDLRSSKKGGPWKAMSNGKGAGKDTRGGKKQRGATR